MGSRNATLELPATYTLPIQRTRRGGAGVAAAAYSPEEEAAKEQWATKK